MPTPGGGGGGEGGPPKYYLGSGDDFAKYPQDCYLYPAHRPQTIEPCFPCGFQLEFWLKYAKLSYWKLSDYLVSLPLPVLAVLPASHGPLPSLAFLACYREACTRHPRGGLRLAEISCLRDSDSARKCTRSAPTCDVVICPTPNKDIQLRRASGGTPTNPTRRPGNVGNTAPWFKPSLAISHVPGHQDFMHVRASLDSSMPHPHHPSPRCPAEK